MTKLLCVAVLIAAQTALADVPRGRPGNGGNNSGSVKSEIEGAAAEAVYESANVPVGNSASLRNGYDNYKVIRSKDGLNQMVCTLSVRAGTPDRRGRPSRESVRTYKCTAEQSTNGKKLAEYNPPRRLG